MTGKIVGVFLAAGRSSRFGSNKLLQPLANGKTIIEQSANTLIKACPDSVAVISSQSSSRLTGILDKAGLTIIENQHSERGMGSSIACGVQATADADGWLIVLADMPFIESHTIASIMQFLTPEQCIIAPSYQQHRGHPVLFSRHFYQQLSLLNNDLGAKHIITNHQDQLLVIESNDRGILLDIDVKDDLPQTRR